MRNDMWTFITFGMVIRHHAVRHLLSLKTCWERLIVHLTFMHHLRVRCRILYHRCLCTETMCFNGQQSLILLPTALHRIIVRASSRMVIKISMSGDKKQFRISNVGKCTDLCRSHGSTTGLHAFVTPDVAFHFKQDTDDAFVRITAEQASASANYIDELKVSLVRSPAYLPASDIQNQLQYYFSKSKVVHLGGVFGIKNSVSKFNNSAPKYFWLVVPHEANSNVLQEKWIVQKGFSTLYQISASNSTIPSLMPLLFGNKEHTDFWSLPSFKSYSQDLCKYLTGCYCWYTSKQGSPLPVVTSGLVIGPSGSGKSSMVRYAAARVGWHVLEADCFEVWSQRKKSLQAKVMSLVQRTAKNWPCVLLLKSLHWIGIDRSSGGQDSSCYEFLFRCFAETVKERCCPIALVGTVPDDKVLPSTALATFMLKVEVPLLSQTNVSEMLAILHRAHWLNLPFDDSDFSVDSVARRLSGLSLSHVVLILERGLDLTSKMQNSPAASKPEALSESNLEWSCLKSSIDLHKKSLSRALGRPEIPNVKWADIGGLEKVKETIIETLQLSLDHPELFLEGLRPCGLVMYGPPGCGKTLLAKAVATECSLNFMSVKGPELLNMYVGQSEENIRNVFVQARKTAPCVIFFDELDSLAPNRGRAGDSGGVMDRVVSQLLAELDSMDENSDVFVIGATNRPDLIDPALIRPGRFDKSVYVGFSETPQEKLEILRACSRRMNLAPEANLEEIAQLCPVEFTGADLQALCTEASLCAVERTIEALEDQSGDRNTTNLNDYSLIVEKEDFLVALKAVKPSVPFDEVLKYKVFQSGI